MTTRSNSITYLSYLINRTGCCHYHDADRDSIHLLTILQYLRVRVPEYVQIQLPSPAYILHVSTRYIESELTVDG